MLLSSVQVISQEYHYDWYITVESQTSNLASPTVHCVCQHDVPFICLIHQCNILAAMLAPVSESVWSCRLPTDRYCTERAIVLLYWAFKLYQKLLSSYGYILQTSRHAHAAMITPCFLCSHGGSLSWWMNIVLSTLLQYWIISNRVKKLHWGIALKWKCTK